jgi:hypothetical protein
MRKFWGIPTELEPNLHPPLRFFQFSNAQPSPHGTHISPTNEASWALQVAHLSHFPEATFLLPWLSSSTGLRHPGQLTCTLATSLLQRASLTLWTVSSVTLFGLSLGAIVIATMAGPSPPTRIFCPRITIRIIRQPRLYLHIRTRTRRSRRHLLCLCSSMVSVRNSLILISFSSYRC